MSKFTQEILIVMLIIVALIVAWKIFMFLFWIILWSIVIVMAYRGIMYCYRKIAN